MTTVDNTSHCTYSKNCSADTIISVLKETQAQNDKFLKPKTSNCTKSLHTKIILTINNPKKQYQLNKLSSIKETMSLISLHNDHSNNLLNKKKTIKLKQTSIDQEMLQKTKERSNELLMQNMNSNNKNSSLLSMKNYRRENKEYSLFNTNKTKKKQIALTKKVKAKQVSLYSDCDYIAYQRNSKQTSNHNSELFLSPITSERLKKHNHKNSENTQIKTLTKDNKSLSLLSRTKTKSRNQYNNNKRNAIQSSYFFDRAKASIHKMNSIKLFLKEEIQNIINQGQPQLKLHINTVQKIKDNIKISHFIKNRDPIYIDHSYCKIYPESPLTNYSYLIEQNIFNMNNFYIFGIFQSYGPQGIKLVSLTKQNLLSYFSNISLYINNVHWKPEEGQIYNTLIKNNYEVIHKWFIKVNKDIKQSYFDPDGSGVVIAMTIAIGNKAIHANLGDLRSTVMMQNETEGKESIDLKDLNSMHTLNNKSEIGRIQQLSSNALRVTQSHNDVKDKIVIKYEYNLNSQTKESIQITRALGLNQYLNFGLSHQPEINEFDINNNSKYLILATQNFYDVIGTSFLLKYLSAIRKHNDRISTTQSLAHLIETYQKKLSLNSSISLSNTNCVYLIVYFNNIKNY